MFKKKKFYKIVYRVFATHTTIIKAKDESQALKKITNMLKKTYFSIPEIISIKEITL